MPELVGAVVNNFTLPTVAMNVTNTSLAPTALPTPILVAGSNVSTIVTGVPVQPIAPSVLNPMFDIAPFHNIHFLWINTIPIWAFVGAILVMYWFWFNISQWRKNSVLAPCYGYKDALMAGSIEAQQVIVFTKSRKWFIRMLTYHSEGILYFKDLLRTDMWHIGSSSQSGTLGGIPAVITKDNFDEGVDPIADIALCTACARFNSGDFGDSQNRARAKQQMELILVTRPDGSECSIRDAINEGLIPIAVSSYDDYVRLRPIMETVWPEGIDISSYGFYDPYEADKFIPKQRSAALNGGVILKDAHDYAEDNIPEPSWWDSNGAAMLFILGGMIIMGISFFATR